MFALSLITAAPDTSIFRTLRKTICSLSRIPLLVLKAPISSNVSPVRKYLYWLKINERIHYTLLSLTHQVLTAILLNPPSGTT